MMITKVNRRVLQALATAICLLAPMSLYCFCNPGARSPKRVCSNEEENTAFSQQEYGPCGEVIRATGPNAKANALAPSTNYQDHETDMLYYGYRYYNPSTGRWLSRDPLAESSSLGQHRWGKEKAAHAKAGDFLKPEYLFVSNDPAGNVDPKGLNVYKVTTSKLCSTPLHREIIGDDGNGGAYVLEFFGKKCWYSVGAFGYFVVARGNVVSSTVRQPALEYIKEQGFKIVETIETSDVYFYPSSNGSVDSHLAKDAAKENPGDFGMYIFLWNDCGTYANHWLDHAREALQQADESAPATSGW